MAGRIPLDPTPPGFSRALLELIGLWKEALDSGFDLSSETENKLRLRTIALDRLVQRLTPPPPLAVGEIEGFEMQSCIVGLVNVLELLLQNSTATEDQKIAARADIVAALWTIGASGTIPETHPLPPTQPYGNPTPTSLSLPLNP